MKTNILKLTLLLITIMFLFFNINYVQATETEDEIIEENIEEEIETTSEISEDELYDSESTTEDFNDGLPTTDYLGTSDISVSTVNSISEMNLKINNILCIILISIGILLILFAIAILIRLKK